MCRRVAARSPLRADSVSDMAPWLPAEIAPAPPVVPMNLQVHVVAADDEDLGEFGVPQLLLGHTREFWRNALLCYACLLVGMLLALLMSSLPGSSTELLFWMSVVAVSCLFASLYLDIHRES
ncbi:hypothetical protein EMCLV155R [Equine molluscum contagiosum-like virus]|nr:hypothetical protein EMCLV155R [Equine molluscum contagiosum-like virus]